MPSYCLAAPSALNSLPVLRHHLSEEVERPVGVTTRAVAGVSAPHRHARSDVRSLCAQAIYLGLSQAYWAALLFWYPGVASRCRGLCAWACGPQESWRDASAGLTVTDRPMQWSQAWRQACGLGILARRLLRRPHRLCPARCCAWVDRLTEGLSVTPASGSRALHALNVLVRLAPTLITL